jgi:hypothetical protein
MNNPAASYFVSSCYKTFSIGVPLAAYIAPLADHPLRTYHTRRGQVLGTDVVDELTLSRFKEIKAKTK